MACLRSQGQQRKQQDQKVVAVHAGGQRQHAASCRGVGDERLPWWLRLVKNLPAMQETWVQSLSQGDPRRRACQSTPVFLPGESHG